MVGRLRDDKLIVYGVATATEMPGLLDSANLAPPLRISAVGDGFGPSDHSSFYAKDLPVLHFFTDIHEDYHRATDDADKINYAGMSKVAAFAERVAREIADRPGRLTFVRAPATTSASSRNASQAYLGSVPDMGSGDVEGLKLSGVRPGSPADSAGLKTGDVIIELGGTVVKDLYTYSDALYAHQPGERITIVALRDGKRVTLQVTLGRRGS
jgi:C-terminal processing protease CtpA/Prc